MALTANRDVHRLVILEGLDIARGIVTSPRERCVCGVECRQACVSLSIGGVSPCGYVSSEGTQTQVIGAISPLPSRDGMVDADARLALPSRQVAHLTQYEGTQPGVLCL